MARPRSIDEPDLIAALARIFGDVGYEGASLSQLARATGLQKASLYHRFPGGKAQMAEEVLKALQAWVEGEVLAHLNGDGPPSERLHRALASFATIYDGGARACLLNMLSTPRQEDGPLSPAIHAAFTALIDGFTRLARDAGQDAATARATGERAVMLVQGSLVLCRGTRSNAPFARALASIEHDLIPSQGATP